jgi:poly(hydroxyalkanoate) depolymerase family esterase
VSLVNNIEFLRHLPKLSEIKGLGSASRGFRRGVSRLTETTGFGTNPGGLRMFSFAPDDLPTTPALVVVLHGCTQNAAGYDVGAGWSALAERYGFALLMPEQKPSNNANGCFNWFLPEDTKRDSGEPCSIRQMIEQMAHEFDIDRDSIFITGLSAGGAMTSVMLAAYPEIFAGGAIIAGLPYGIATNMQEALKGMFQSPPRAAGELGDLVRKASKHKGPWPKLSVWHGSADRTVNPSNADEIVKQWLDVHRLPAAPMSEATVDGYPRQIWWNAEGETVIESYTITNMSHGTPLGAAANDERYGTEGAFLIEAGISSSYHIANFFGLTERIHQPKESSKENPKENLASNLTSPERAPETASAHTVRAAGDRRAEPRDQPRRRAIDVSAIITRALTAAGLIKNSDAT